MNEWSSYCQNEHYPTATRIMLLDPDDLPQLKRWLGIEDGMKVLDMGCGAGHFTFYLASCVKNCEFHGFDMDDELLASARCNVPANSTNVFSFMQGDALDTKLDADTYDLIVSHTLLSNLDEPWLALKEMRRIAKPGGIIASCDSQRLSDIPYSPGYYPADELEEIESCLLLKHRVSDLYEKVKPFTTHTEQCGSGVIPYSFAVAGIHDIHLHSLGRAFSLSDTRYSEEVRRTYIEQDYVGECIKFENFLKLDAFKEIISDEDREAYLPMLKKQRDWRLAHLSNNTSWAWYGGSSLIVVGRA